MDVIPYARFKATSTATDVGLGVLECNRYSRISFLISGLTTETIQLQVSHDGGVTWTAGIKVLDLTTGALFATATLANGAYNFQGVCAGHIRFVKSAAVESATLSGSLIFGD